MKASEQVRYLMSDTPLEILARCGGYYECPTDGNGRRLGKLVGYAGRYEAPEDGLQKQYVGYVYANFAEAEQYPHVMERFARMMREKHIIYDTDVFVGAPIGGYSFSEALAKECDCKVIKAEKRVIALATGNSREQSKLVFGRHNVRRGERAAIIEDVCNNMSTTAELIDLIEGAGGIVTCIICLLNRSLDVHDVYVAPRTGRKYRVLSLERKPIMEYRQDDPLVRDDVIRGNVVWKPKDEWEKLGR